jgi:hypothetical protein
MKRALVLLILGTLVSGVAAYAATTRIVTQPATTTKG